jgi:hypothetical protein
MGAVRVGVMRAKPTNGIGGCSNPIENSSSPMMRRKMRPDCVTNMATLRCRYGRRSAMMCQCQEPGLRCCCCFKESSSNPAIAQPGSRHRNRNAGARVPRPGRGQRCRGRRCGLFRNCCCAPAASCPGRVPWASARASAQTQTQATFSGSTRPPTERGRRLASFHGYPAQGQAWTIQGSPDALSDRV